MDKTKKIISNVPSYFSPNSNIMWKAMLSSIGNQDNNVVAQSAEAKKQIFVELAEKEYLDSLGDNVGVYRPLELNLSDDRYRKLIEFLSFYPKQVKSLILNILDIFYDPTFSRYNIQTTLDAPFNLVGGESLVVRTEKDKEIEISKSFSEDGSLLNPNLIMVVSTAGMYVGQSVYIIDDVNREKKATVTDLTNNSVTVDIDVSAYRVSNNAVIVLKTYQYITFKSTDFVNPGQVTTEEIVSILNLRLNNITAQSIASDTKVNLRTNTPGQRGYIQVLGGTANNFLHFPTTPSKILRVQVSEIRPNEIIISIPSTIPALRRVLQGSHHFHSDSSLDENWKGSFIYDPDADYTVLTPRTVLNQSIKAGQVYTQISVTNAGSIPNEAGYVILNFGMDRMEYPVPYIGRPNNNTLLLNPGYVFKEDHDSLESIHTVLAKNIEPRTGGIDKSIYLVGIETAREQVQEIVRTIVATGVVIRWDINYPVCGLT